MPYKRRLPETAWSIFFAQYDVPAGGFTDMHPDGLTTYDDALAFARRAYRDARKSVAEGKVDADLARWSRYRVVERETVDLLCVILKEDETDVDP